MVGKTFIAIVASMVALGAALAVAALYVDWQAMMAPPTSPQGPVAGEGSPAPEAPGSASGEPAGRTPGAPQPTAETADATKTPAAEPASVPTFDVVVVEPSGEGVIAGRATPGWTVSVQSGGTKVGEAKADLQGEWSVVLEKPLAAGDHSLSLKVTSPDGRLALSSQETVRVAVGADAKAGAPPAEVPSQTGAALTSQQTAQAAATPPPAGESNTTRALARSEQPPSAQGGGAVPPARPKLVFKTVNYADKGSGTGTVTITGTSEPGAEISIAYGNESLAKTRADREGNWTVAIAKTLGMGSHSFRAERAGETGGVAGAAMVTLERVEPKPEPPATAVATATPAPAPQVAAGQSQGVGSKIVYVIRRGDTLWAIAKRYLGSGLRYTSIFQDNRTTISNPNLIHPKQEVKVTPR